jgi:hypothetical protein
MTRLDARTASERGWMPDFCSLPILGSVVLMVELIVLVVLIAPGQGGWPTLRDLFAASFLAQWIAERRPDVQGRAMAGASVAVLAAP